MGTIQFVGDHAVDHEGFVGRALDDGTVTSSWPDPPGRHLVWFRAACDCGWQGPTLISPGEDESPPSPALSEEPQLEREWWEHIAPHVVALVRQHQIDIEIDDPEAAEHLRWLINLGIAQGARPPTGWARQLAAAPPAHQPPRLQPDNDARPEEYRVTAEGRDRLCEWADGLIGVARWLADYGDVAWMPKLAEQQYAASIGGRLLLQCRTVSEAEWEAACAGLRAGAPAAGAVREVTDGVIDHQRHIELTGRPVLVRSFAGAVDVIVISPPGWPRLVAAAPTDHPLGGTLRRASLDAQGITEVSS